MKYLTLIPVLCLLLVPSVAFGQGQIPPADHTLDYELSLTTPDWFNAVDYDIKGPDGHLIINDTSSQFTLDNRAGAEINMEQASRLTNMAGLVNHGTISNSKGGSLINDTGHLVNNGVINLEMGSFNNLADSGLTNTHNFNINAHGAFSSDSGGNVKNTGFVHNNAGAVFNTEGTLENNGTIKIQRDSEFHNSGVITQQRDELGDVATLTNDGTFFNHFNGTIYNYSGDDTNIKGMVNQNGTLTNNGTIHNSDRDTQDAALINMVNANITNNDQIINTAKFTNHGIIDNGQNGTINNGDNGSNKGGNLLLEQKSQLNNLGRLTNEALGILTNNGKIDTHASVFGARGFTNNGTYQGSGIVIGKWTDHGHIKPGNHAVLESAGVMTTDGDYYKRGGSHEIELGGLFDGGGDHAITEFDWIDVTGNVELAGLLNVSLIDGFEKRINRGQVFEFIRVGGTLSGQFYGLGEGALVGNFGGQDLFITYGGMGDGGGVALFTNAVPEPTTMLIWSMLAGLGMTTRRRRAA